MVKVAVTKTWKYENVKQNKKSFIKLLFLCLKLLLSYVIFYFVMVCLIYARSTFYFLLLLFWRSVSIWQHIFCSPVFLEHLCFVNSLPSILRVYHHLGHVEHCGNISTKSRFQSRSSLLVHIVHILWSWWWCSFLLVAMIL